MTLRGNCKYLNDIANHNDDYIWAITTWSISHPYSRESLPPDLASYKDRSEEERGCEHQSKEKGTGRSEDGKEQYYFVD